MVVVKSVVASIVEGLHDDMELVDSFIYVTTDIAPFIAFPPILNFINSTWHNKLLM